MRILGLWDGHDAGAAILVDGQVAAAANEERFTRRKLEVAFPSLAIRSCLETAGLRAGEIDLVAVSTTDFAKTLARVAPATKESYYAVRRRQAPPGVLSSLRRRLKYRVTEWPPTRLSTMVSRLTLQRTIRREGLPASRLLLCDHHEAHAAAAACGSPFESCVVLTIDGVGDGLCSSVSTYRGGRLDRVASTSAGSSPGVFFELVTNLLNMRELEDEGKVMALADFARAVPDDRNPLMRLLGHQGARFVTRHPSRQLRSSLARVLWHHPNEEFAAMAQRALLAACVGVAAAAVRTTGEANVALAGGVASNVKVNRAIRLLPEVRDVYVFPHMGDGGLALGAALLGARQQGVLPRLRLGDLGLGPRFDDEAILAALAAAGLRPVGCPDAVVRAADLIASGQVVLWFQGRMEYGPRALGHRSVLARPDRPDLKDRLNLVLKRRVWYQPFCPSLLENDARRLIADRKGALNRDMTMAYEVTALGRACLAGAINVDGSCRPQIVAEQDGGPFAQLLREVRARTGVGAVLNTSFNIHGEPLVCTPDEAIDVFQRSGADALAIGPFLVERRPSD